MDIVYTVFKINQNIIKNLLKAQKVFECEVWHKANELIMISF